MTEREARRAAAELAARRVRAITVTEVLREHPDGRDAERVFEALRTGDLELSWMAASRALKVRARVVALAASPLLIPTLAVVWLAWRMKRLMIIAGDVLGAWKR